MYSYVILGNGLKKIMHYHKIMNKCHLQSSQLIWAIIIGFASTGCKEVVSKEAKPGKSNTEESILLADPTIFHYENTYYLYGTSGRDANQGFEVYTSEDKINWEGPKGANDGYALRKEESFGDQGFWAPQVFEYNGKFHMAYTANENIAIATAGHPTGPFVQSDKAALEAPVKQIDPFIFMDDDGKKYLYHVRLTEGNRIFVAVLLLKKVGKTHKMLTGR
jgi:beta-xylosidase